MEKVYDDSGPDSNTAQLRQGTRPTQKTHPRAFLPTTLLDTCSYYCKVQKMLCLSHIKITALQSVKLWSEQDKLRGPTFPIDGSVGADCDGPLFGRGDNAHTTYEQ
jgi:hypothetical protein